MIMSPMRSYRMNRTEKSSTAGSGGFVRLGPGSSLAMTRIHSVRHAISTFCRFTC
jgi:hypothetical protein